MLELRIERGFMLEGRLQWRHEQCAAMGAFEIAAFGELLEIVPYSSTAGRAKNLPESRSPLGASVIYDAARACKVTLGRPRSRRTAALSLRPISSHSQSRKNDTFGRLSLDFGATK
jgi:hypothetical protein